MQRTQLQWRVASARNDVHPLLICIAERRDFDSVDIRALLAKYSQGSCFL